MGEELLSLRWNNHQSHFVDILTFLREQEIFIDVTLACGGKLYPAHKFVLSTCSDYFKQMFTKNPNKHPIVFMKDVLSKDLEALLDFMYHGEVNVPQSSLGSLIKTAEGLQIKGLAVPDDPPLPRKENNSKEKRDLKARDHSYSPAPKRLKAREKSPSVNSNSHNNSQRRSSVCENNLSADAVDEDSRTSAQSTVSDSVNAKSNLNSHSTNHEQDNSLSENINPLSSTEPAAGPSGLQRSKEEQVEIKQEEEVVDLDDDDSWNRFEGNGDEGMDDSLMGNLGSDNTPNFSDLLNNPSDVHPLNPSNDPAMKLLLEGMTPRRVARLLCGTDTMCPLCHKNFAYPESMIRHCVGHLPMMHHLKCSNCGKTFHRKDQFKYHISKCDVFPPIMPPALPPIPPLL